MSIIRTSIERPLMMIMAIIAFALFGLVAWQKLPIDNMPDMDLPFVVVQLLYPGAGPEEIELNVVKQVEEAVSTVEGIKNIESNCMDNMGIIVLEFNAEVNADFAAIEVKDKVDQILYNLPEGLEKPIISKFDFNAEPVVILAVTGDMEPVEIRQYVDQNISDRYSQVMGVAQVDVIGGREREIHVTLDAEKLAAHDLSIFQVYPVLLSQNVMIPAGYITGEYREYSVNFDGEFQSIEEIRQLQIPVSRQGTNYLIRLDEIATISDSYADVRELSRFQGAESVELRITKGGDANTVSVAENIMVLTEELRKTLPKELTLSVVEDVSIFIKGSIDDTYSNILQGILLTAVILFIFLFDWRLTIIAGVTMPVSLIIAMIGVQAMGFTLNTVTMMSLTIAVGILVTNAIVVIENIVRHRDTGQDVRHASLEGTEEIFVSILASTLTNLAVFIPIASTTGIIGSIFKSLGLTIVFATIASLLLSFTLVPLMSAHMLKRKDLGHCDRNKKNPVDRFMGLLERSYEKVLERILNSWFIKITLIIATLVLLVGTMIGIAPKLGFDFVPSTDEGFINISVELPVGTPLSRTNELLIQMEKVAEKTPFLKAISSSIGGSGTQTGVQNGAIKLELVDRKDRDLSVNQIIAQLRPQMAFFPDVKINVSSAGQNKGPVGSGDVSIEILGNEMDSLIIYTERALEVLKTIPELTEFNSSWKGGKPEITITPKREMMEYYGLMGSLATSISAEAVGGLLRYNINGYDQAIYREAGEEYPIRVQLDENDRKDIRDVAMMPILTPRGPVPLEAIAEVAYDGGLSSITRKNRKVMLDVSANITNPAISKGAKAVEVMRILKEQAPLPLGYSYEAAGDQEQVEETNAQLGFAALLAVALTLMLLIALLESIPMALVIFATLPLGLIGVVWSLYLTGNSVSMIAMLSIIMLIGIVVNNAILMIDYARMQRKKFGISAHMAIVQASGTKLKAILMSNIAIIVSMIPMALGVGTGGEFRAPFAITTIGGVFVSTIMTFFLIPILYVITAPKHEEEEL